MASTLTYFAITVLLVAVDLTSSLELSQPLKRVQRAVLSDNPTEELSNLINVELSRANVQSLLKSVVPKSWENLQSRSANEDLLDGFLRSYLEDPNLKSSLLRATASEDVQSILTVLNSELGGPVLTVSNNSIVINVDAIQTILITYSKGYIQELYRNDFLMQLVVQAVAEEQIKLACNTLRTNLADVAIPVEYINDIVALIVESNRSKRDLNDLILGLLRPQIAAILTPIYEQVNAVLNNVITVVLSFYEPNQPSSPLLRIIANVTNVLVLRTAEVVVIFQMNVNTVFANLINGTTVAARRRRDVDLEFENFYDFDNFEGIDWAVSHKRVARSIFEPFEFIFNIFGEAIGFITNSLNTLVKNIFINILSSQYANIGQLVTLPLRIFVAFLLDTILPCSTCVSIV